MPIKLRGHHLFCLLGFRGKGYSEKFCLNMTAIYEQLRLHPETEIEIIEGPDDICRAFPADQHAHCENRSVYRKDSVILEKVGASVGTVHTWGELCGRVADRVVPDDIPHICHDCQWEPYGLCREGVRLMNERKPLPEIKR